MNGHVFDGRERRAPLAVFIAATIFIFFSSLSAADSIGFVPNYIDGTEPASSAGSSEVAPDQVALSSLPELGAQGTSASATATPAPKGVLPTRISIPSINLDLPVQNPGTRDINALDALLQKGPARYVDSAKLGEKGNMIIFAHSSHLPIVHNKMFQAFNKIPDLKAGDAITLSGADGKDYLYTVTAVRTADVNDATIDLSPTQGTKLTLVTCDTLTGKSARYILEADFEGAV